MGLYYANYIRIRIFLNARLYQSLNLEKRGGLSVVSTLNKIKNKIKSYCGGWWMGREGRAVPPTPFAVVSRFETRGLVQDERSFSEAGLIASMAVANVARADPGFAHESLVNSRLAAGVAEEERAAAED
jgi:hypothetical protein